MAEKRAIKRRRRISVTTSETKHVGVTELAKDRYRAQGRRQLGRLQTKAAEREKKYGGLGRVVGAIGLEGAIPFPFNLAVAEQVGDLSEKAAKTKADKVLKEHEKREKLVRLRSIHRNIEAKQKKRQAKATATRMQADQKQRELHTPSYARLALKHGYQP